MAIYNGDNNDNIYTGTDGADSIFGFGGDDTLSGGNGADVIRGGTGNDYLEGDGGDDLLYGDEGDDTLIGGDGIDSLSGGDGNDILYGSAGDTLLGGNGNDLYVLLDENIIIAEDGTGLDTVDVGFSYTLGTGLENLVLDLGAGAIDGTGNGLDNYIRGNNNRNTLRGMDGNDFLDGGDGIDTLEGGNGKDILIGGDGLDILTGGAGNDRFVFEDARLGTDQITDFNVANDTIAIFAPPSQNGPSGPIDDFFFTNKGLTANAFIGTHQFHIGTSATTTSHRFIYNQTSGALFFDADGSGAGAQIQLAQLNAGLELTNRDIFVFSQYSQLDNLEENNNVANPPGSNPPGSNPPGSNPPGSNPPRGTGGNDTLRGSDRGETLNGLGGNDTLLGFGGNDTLLGGDGNDSLNGGNGNDFNKGGAGNDRIDAGAGNDWLWGGTRRNTLISGAGADVFVLERGQGQQRILDFANGEDKLGLTPGIKFRNLDIAQRGRNTIISLNGDRLAILAGVRADQITAADFTPAPIG